MSHKSGRPRPSPTTTITGSRRSSTSGTTVLQNAYDGDGKRIKKTESDSIVFRYQGLNVLFGKDLNTGVITKRFYANGLQVAKMVGSTTTYLHEDYLGSIRFVSSSTGSQAFSSNYVPYGPQYGASGTPDEFLCAGKIYDGSTGFYYFGARFYDPTIGRFVTQDSYSGVRADPQSFNRYAYTRNNPMKFIDPNGHLYLDRYSEDGYSRGYHKPIAQASTSQPAPVCNSSPDVCLSRGGVCLSRGGNSQYSPMPVSGSPDRFLTNWGNNQYTPLSQPPPGSTTTTETTTTTTTNNQVTKTGCDLWCNVHNALPAAQTFGIAVAVVNADWYLISHGWQSTPDGYWQAYQEGLTQGFAEGPPNLGPPL